ncbi:MAG: ABC transporter ATP-binding protein [Candidatus Moduliflexus flocculans]|nr:ABC transporter ATP-binding protein [Candidatus Moduliflexus flocculans]
MDRIVAVGVVKNYESGKVTVNVLKQIDLVIDSDDFVGITGASGSGKTTLLYVLSGLELPTAGTVALLGKATGDYNDRELASLRQRKIGFIFQFYNLIPNLTVRENVELAAVLAKNRAPNRIDEVLAMVGMLDKKDAFPNELSGGMQQRVAIARALVNDPEVIFADEPTGNLDSVNAAEIMGILRDLNRMHKKTIVLVTHGEEFLRYCNRNVRLADGKVVKDVRLRRGLKSASPGATSSGTSVAR